MPYIISKNVNIITSWCNWTRTNDLRVYLLLRNGYRLQILFTLCSAAELYTVSCQ